MTVDDVKVGQEFVYVAPSGRESVFQVVELDAVTRQGDRMPRAISPRFRHPVFITDELLRQGWWRVAGLVRLCFW